MSDILTKAQRERREGIYGAIVLGAIAAVLLAIFGASLGQRIRVGDVYLSLIGQRACTASTYEGRAVKLYRCGKPGHTALVAAEDIYSEARAMVVAADAKAGGQ